MTDYLLQSPVDGPNPSHDFTDEERTALLSEEEDDVIASANSDDEGPATEKPKPKHKQLDDFKKLVLSQKSRITWSEIWADYPLISDSGDNGQSEIDGRTALHILVAEHVQSTETEVTKALIEAIAFVTRRYPGLVSRLDDSGKTPLYEAIAKKQSRVVRNIVNNCLPRKSTSAGTEHPLTAAVKVRCNSNGRKENALHIAFREFPKAVDKLTLKTMCDHATADAVAFADEGKFTPLHYAVRYRHSSKEQFEMIKTLLQKGQATRENPASRVKDVLDHYAVVPLDSQEVRMSVFEYHEWTRIATEQSTTSTTLSRGKRSGKDGDTGKSAKHNDKRRELEQATANVTADGKRNTGAAQSHATMQPSAANVKPAAEPIRNERLPERTKDERTGKVINKEKDERSGKGSKDKDDRNDPSKQNSQQRPAKQGGHRGTEEQKSDTVKDSAPANIGITRSNTGAPPPPKPKAKEPLETPEEKRQRREEWSAKIKNELKIQVLRNRPFDKATRFLYGKNLPNIHIYFDYQGQSTTVNPETFMESFKDVEFDEVLKYVAFPPVKVQDWKKHKMNTLKTEAAGRSDMLFFFEWLRKEKGVKRILKVIVDDIHPDEPPHSDEAIERCLRGMGVEELAWQKDNMDPETICRIDGHGDDNEHDEDRARAEGEDDGEDDDARKSDIEEKKSLAGTLRRLHLWWNGDNAVLRGWSDPDGLRHLDSIRRVHLITRKTLESRERTERNINTFKLRMKGRDAKEAPRKASLVVQEDSADVSKLAEPAEGEKRTRFAEPESPEQTNGIEVTYAQIGQPSGGAMHSGSHEREVVRPSHRWLKSSDDFGTKISNVWSKLVNERAKNKLVKPRDIVVALIDDGVDATHNDLQDKIIPGRSLSSDHDRIRPWFGSEKGHGTLMATSICRVCPMAKIYPIRLHTTGAVNSWQSSIDADSAIKAIDAAVDKGVDIISISWTIKVPPEPLHKRLKAAIDRAVKERILIFCSAADGGHISGQHYPSAIDTTAFIRVGAARANGLPYDKVGELTGVEFIMPGVDVMPPETSAGISQEVRDRSVTGSSVAAALGSGLAALVLYCVYIAVLADKDGMTLDHLADLHEATKMRKAIERFGMSTSKDSGNKFVEVFHKLDKTKEQLTNSTLQDTARGLIAALARDLVPRS